MNNDALFDAINNLRTAIAFAQRPGNEGQALMVSKGNATVYRPVKEVLEPALNQLNAIEDLLRDLEMIRSTHFGSNSPILGSVKYAMDAYVAKLNPNLQAANAAKAAMRGGK